LIERHSAVLAGWLGRLTAKPAGWIERPVGRLAARLAVEIEKPVDKPVG
jgi:hypothetical protein